MYAFHEKVMETSTIDVFPSINENDVAKMQID
jgi:hypothetical protein